MTDTIYTDEIVTELTEAYEGLRASGADYDTRTELVREFADRLGVKEASVRSKLVSLKIYLPKEKAKTGSTSRTKEEIASAFGAVIGKPVNSLANASKADLETVWKFVMDINSQIEIRAQELANTQ